MASLPLPALPRWVPPVALVAWVGLLAIAAWLRTLGSVWADVTANVVSSAAGVAFAATGVAAALTYWQQRRLQRELAGATVAQLNQATSQVQELLTELLRTLRPVIPAVKAARPAPLARLLSPPTHAEARALAEQLLASIGPVKTLRAPSGRVLVRPLRLREQDFTTPELVAAEAARLSRVQRTGEPTVDLWVRARTVVGALARYKLGPGDRDRFAQKMRPHWDEAVDIVDRLSGTVEQLVDLQAARPLIRDTRQLVATVGALRTKSGPTLLRGKTPKATLTQDVEQALGELSKLTSAALAISEHLTTLRADFEKKVKHAAGGADYDATWALRNVDEHSVRRGDARIVPTRVLAAWNELRIATPLPRAPTRPTRRTAARTSIRRVRPRRRVGGT